RRLHDARREGELTPEAISEIWLATQREALGEGVDLPEGTGYATYWAYIPHFIHVPFYVYAYAFGDCLVNSLYAAYHQDAAGAVRTHRRRSGILVQGARRDLRIHRRAGKDGVTARPSR